MLPRWISLAMVNLMLAAHAYAEPNIEEAKANDARYLNQAEFFMFLANSIESEDGFTTALDLESLELDSKPVLIENAKIEKTIKTSLTITQEVQP